MAINFLNSIKLKGTLEVEDNDSADIVARISNSGDDGWLNLYQNGTSKILLHSNSDSYINGGNVGIGTTAPGTKLFVVGNVSVSAGKAFRMYNAANNGWGEMSFIEANDIIQFNRGIQNSGGDWKFPDSGNSYVNANEGNFGIGTTGPNEKLQVAGNIHAYAPSGINAALFASTSPGVTTIAIRSSGITHFNGGNVGIGTTTPLDLLALHNNSAGTVDAQMNFTTAATGQAIGDGFRVGWNGSLANIYLFEDAPMRFATNNVERMRILSGGNVGIGTTSPARKLHVNSGSDNANTIFESTDTAVTIRLKDSTGSAEIESRNDFRFSNNAGVDQRMVISSAGAIRFNNYSAGTLVTDASGNITVSSGGGAGGPFLPLAGGGMTGDLFLLADADILKSGTNPFRLFTNGTLALSVSSSQNATFAGSVSLIDNKIINLGSSNDLQIYHNATNSYISNTQNSGDLIIQQGANGKDLVFKSDNGSNGLATYFRLDGGQVETVVFKDFNFEDNVKAKFGSSADLQIYHNATDSFIDNSTGNLTIDSGVHLLARTASGESLANFYANGANEFFYDNIKKFETTNTGVTITGAATATTFLGDLNGTINTATTAATQANATNNTTVATTAFVQNLIGTIPAGLVFQGTWNAATNTPTLASGSGTTGHFYIVSTSGSTNLDGVTDWVTGDWAVFIEQGGTDAWEKIDNSSVLDGAGTGQKVALWSGSGTSNTLTDGPITFSGSNSIFGGDVTTGGRVTVNNVGSDKKIAFRRTGANNFSIEHDAASLYFYNESTSSVLLNMANNGNATFAGDVNVTGANLNFLANDATQIKAKESMFFTIDSDNNQTSRVFQVKEGSGNALMTIQEAGNVGIGTDSPNHKLQVEGGSAESIINLTTTGNPNGLDIIEGTDGHAAIWLRENAYMHFATNSVERMRITATGDVGIGTTSPRTKLEVGSTGSLGAVTNKVISTTIDGGYSTANSLQYNVNAFIATTFGTTDIFASTGGETDKNFYTGLLSDNSYFNGARYSVVQGGAERLTVARGGNVGIGKTVPDTKLHVVSSAVSGTVYNSDDLVTLEKNGSTNVNIIGASNASTNVLFSDTVRARGLIGYAHSSDHMRFNTAASERMRIDSVGNVGINTTNPIAKLHIVGDVQIGDSSNPNAFGAFQVNQNANSDEEGIAILSLNKGRSIRIWADETVSYISSGDGGNGNLILNQGSGSIGIGTTDPKSKLQVDGGIQMAGDTDTPSADKVGTLRYYDDANNSYVDMCMKTGSTTYAWINIVQNNF